jgi:hypothetical protein
MARTAKAIAYGRSNCFICGKRVSSAGLGYVSHMRKHVREGRATEEYSGEYPYGHYNYEALAKVKEGPSRV